ncbi:MAG: glutamate--tRNA ligase family protein [Bacteriovoracaceae bacterium]
MSVQEKDSKRIVSRLAPTPSGYLHLGNAYNFILTWWIVKSLNGKLYLRIDDADQARTRPEFLEDIFETLDWLGLDYDFGPQDSRDFLKNYSQGLKTETYFKTAMSAKGAFACECSRKQILAASADGIYKGVCAPKKLAFQRGQCSLRLKTGGGPAVKVDGRAIDVNQVMGDFVLWRKDDIPSYQLTSVVDDKEMGTSLIVRGQDLLESSAAQIYLSEKLGWSHLGQCQFIHHPLLLDEKGEKYSKSQLQAGPSNIHLKTMRQEGLYIKDVLRMLEPRLGTGKESPANLQELLKLKPPFI